MALLPEVMDQLIDSIFLGIESFPKNRVGSIKIQMLGGNPYQARLFAELPKRGQKYDEPMPTNQIKDILIQALRRTVYGSVVIVIAFGKVTDIQEEYSIDIYRKDTKNTPASKR